MVREIILKGNDGDFVFSHSDHWHGAPVVREGGGTGYSMHFTSVRPATDDHDMPPVDTWFSLANHLIGTTTDVSKPRKGLRLSYSRIIVFYSCKTQW